MEIIVTQNLFDIADKKGIFHMESVTKSLKQARIRRGLSQTDVASILNISRQSVSKWETGRSLPDIDNLIRLSNLYHISIDELVKGFDEEKDETKKLNTLDFQNKTKGTHLLLLSLASSLVPFIGIFLPFYVLRQNDRCNSSYKLIIIVSILVIIISLWGTFSILADTLQEKLSI